MSALGRKRTLGFVELQCDDRHEKNQPAEGERARAYVVFRG